MITTGVPWSSAIKTEIVDLANGRSCSDLEDFPMKSTGAVGANLQGTPVVCGDEWVGGGDGFYQKKCFGFKNGQWQEYPSLKKKRTSAAGVMNKNKWHIFGGYRSDHFSDSSEITSDIVNENGEVVDGPALPTSFVGHAITSINKTVSILSGGFGTFFYNHDTEIFTPGPTLLEDRLEHGSATIVDKVTKAKIPVVTGGISMDVEWQFPLNSTELLINSRWQKGTI